MASESPADVLFGRERRKTWALEFAALKGTVRVSGDYGFEVHFPSVIVDDLDVERFARASKRLRPVHPGDILKNDFLEPLEITSYRLSKELGVSRPTIAQLVVRRRNVTAEMALRLARYFGTSAQVWQNLRRNTILRLQSRRSARS